MAYHLALIVSYFSMGVAMLFLVTSLLYALIKRSSARFDSGLMK